ncbi:tRNA lysidine(34) synthetase TilS [Algoriphagus sediminis]|uniref:tRNA(Ile)-lysidine synthase n=1 Tax=Algoriphagus sediminis TaxID=3057113 RepID=A0ABT7YFZ7_9BACT|nr:tRNA lysidine(34) synthetase TilS [Algoriphagus sediminis]MDN3205444.1 tRNA lysidine(34) synthetase TilS [Algoriphagus sediminis]
MIKSFIHHIQEKGLLNFDKKYLLACSGGLDSMCLAHLLLESKISFEIAHVNYQLRGAESKGDYEFVEAFCESNSIAFNSLETDTHSYVERNKVSVQEAARDIRYDFFEKICREKNLEGVLTAHHQDDQIETVFINLLRGTGIEGLAGMSEKRGDVIRPLLNFSRSELVKFATELGIFWREDSSNQKTDYLRNKLRHDVLPALFSSREDARQNLLNSLQRIKDTGRAFSSLYQEWKRKFTSKEGDLWVLNAKGLKNHSGAQSLLFYWVRDFGFNSDQANDMHTALILAEPGKLFNSSSHLANVDRNQILIAEKGGEQKKAFIQESDIQIETAAGTFSILKVEPGDFLDKNPENAMLDLSQLEFPLTLRAIETGDRFVPLGMKNEKKISDFLIDLKVPLIKKARVNVLLSGNRIAWVLGYRIADWAKVNSGTKEIIYFKKESK